VVTGLETCEDGDTDEGDGCNFECRVEPGYLCTGMPPMACATVCGDTMVAGAEQCDDGNTMPGDACDSTCQIERRMETEPNDTFAQAQLNPALEPGWLYRGSILQPVDRDYFLLHVTELVDLRLEVFGPVTGLCGDFDVTLLVYDSNNMVVGGDDDSGPGFCPDLNPLGNAWARQLAPGDYTIEIADYDLNDMVPEYNLFASVMAVCGDGVVEATEECEGTDRCNLCKKITLCGDGVREGLEICDDGNLLPADGCDGLCRVTAGYRCPGNPNVCVPVEMTCNDTLNEDGDGTTDQADPDCSLAAATAACPPGQRQLVVTSRDTPRALQFLRQEESLLLMPEGLGNVQRAVVRLNVFHPDQSELTVTLRSPTGTVLDLTSGNGAGDPFDSTGYVATILDDACAMSIVDGQDPFTGCYRPEDPLANLQGEPVAGTWTLTVLDAASDDAGTLVNWAVMFCASP